MVEYTKEDINIFGDEERALNAIGKECYFGYNIDEVLAKANNDSNVEVLEKCNSMVAYPFISTTGFTYTFMIVKKEEPKPEYVPFKNRGEFISTFEDNTTIMHVYGLWLYEKINDYEEKTPRLVTEMWSDGVVIGNDRDITTWKELLERFVFENNEPCGRKVEFKF